MAGVAGSGTSLLLGVGNSQNGSFSPLAVIASSSAVENVDGRQVQKSQATAIHGHMRASGQRPHAMRDAR